MEKNFYIFLVIINNCANKLSSNNDHLSECKIYDRVYEHFSLNRSEKMQLESLLKHSEEKYVYYSEGSDFFYPNATKSQIAKLQNINKDKNNQFFYCDYEDENSSYGQEFDSSDITSSRSTKCESLNENQETFLQNQSNIKPLTVKNLTLHVMALKAHSLKEK